MQPPTSREPLVAPAWSLLAPAGAREILHRDQPSCFRYLRLDEIVATATAGQGDYHLEEFYYSPASNATTMSHRRDVTEDLIRPDLRAAAAAFCDRMSRARAECTAVRGLRSSAQSGLVAFDANRERLHAVHDLVEALIRLSPHSAGMQALRDHLCAWRATTKADVHLAELDSRAAALASTPVTLMVKDDAVALVRTPLLRFGVPTVSASSSESAHDVFDLALACSQGADGVVPSSFRLSPRERILTVTGVNQAGKTTFARAFGQVHWLAALGLLVPARDAELLPFDAMHTVFEAQEAPGDGLSALQDELVRLRAALQGSNARSIIVLNEILASTTRADAMVLIRDVLARIRRLGARALLVTYIPFQQTTGMGESTW